MRAALIECGLELIQEKGVEALTLREIGSRLGVSRSAAYRHFADKAALIEAVTEAGFLTFGDALQAAKDNTSGDFWTRMNAMARAYVRFANEHRPYFEVMFAVPPQPGCASAIAGERAFAILEQTIREGQEIGEIRPGDSTMLARAVWAQVHGISTLRLDATDPDFVALSSEVLRKGLSVSTSSG
ncbi:MAG: TetR/AcrR family transcriptional regulator [Acidobacteriia bacterium]|nr:TetR/AcrR family transcriptional regulator [Terriglobia bacterium]